MIRQLTFGANVTANQILIHFIAFSCFSPSETVNKYHGVRIHEFKIFWIWSHKSESQTFLQLLEFFSVILIKETYSLWKVRKAWIKTQFQERKKNYKDHRVNRVIVLILIISHKWIYKEEEELVIVDDKILKNSDSSSI